MQIKSKSNSNFFFCSSFFFLPVSMANLSCGSYHLLQLAFLFSSVSLANMSHVVAVSVSGLALLSSSVSTANLSCMLATTFSSLSFLSNSFFPQSIQLIFWHCFNLLRVSSRYFSWSSVSDEFLFSSCIFWLFFLLYLFRVLSSAVFSSVLQSLKLSLL